MSAYYEKYKKGECKAEAATIAAAIEEAKPAVEGWENRLFVKVDKQGVPSDAGFKPVPLYETVVSTGNADLLNEIMQKLLTKQILLTVDASDVPFASVDEILTDINSTAARVSEVGVFKTIAKALLKTMNAKKVNALRLTVNDIYAAIFSKAVALSRYPNAPQDYWLKLAAYIKQAGTEQGENMSFIDSWLANRDTVTLARDEAVDVNDLASIFGDMSGEADDEDEATTAAE